MVIDIDLRVAPATVQLVEPDDFKAFKIAARGATTDPGQLTDAVARIGRMTADRHVFVDIEALRSLAGERALQRDWIASLDGMLEYARASGWINDAGAIRVHVEWTA